MKVYNKLVRDRIPEIIEKSGSKCEIEILDNEQYIAKLKEKLTEELDEFLSAEDKEEVYELADMVEVIYAVLNYKGITHEKFEEIRLGKQKERGGFDKKLFLKAVYDLEDK